MDVLEITPDSYLVSHNGKPHRLPRVTSVIGRFYPIQQPEEVLAVARARGKAVHKATHIIDAHPNGLDWDTVDAPLRPYLQAYERFLAECEAMPIEREFPCVDLVMGYCGTADGLYYMRWQEGGEGESLVDIKTTAEVEPHHKLQTAAYEAPTRKRLGKRRPLARHVLYLRGDGKYELVRHQDPRDLAAFLGLVSAFHWEMAQ